MTTLQTADFMELAPSVLTNDTEYNALLQTFAEEMVLIAEKVPDLFLWDRIPNMDTTLLDILAGDLKVDWWDSTYTLAEKRSVLAEAMNVHRMAGTPAAVAYGVSAIYPRTSIQEWTAYGGLPYHFKILIQVAPSDIDASKLQRVLNRVQYFKNVRSVLDGVQYMSETITSTSYVMSKVTGFSGSLKIS